jgi:hypothetical protein
MSKFLCPKSAESDDKQTKKQQTHYQIRGTALAHLLPRSTDAELKSVFNILVG